MDKKYKNDKSKMRKFEKNGQFEKKMDNLNQLKNLLVKKNNLNGCRQDESY